MGLTWRVPGQAPGVEGVKQTFTMFRTAFPDLYFTAAEQIAEGDKIASRVVTRGITATSAYQGIPATGKKVKSEEIDILRFANGKTVERWGVFDNLGLLQQLGAIPSRRSPFGNTSPRKSTSAVTMTGGAFL